MGKIKALIIAHLEENFNNCTYYTVEMEKSQIKNMRKNEEKLLESLLLKIKDKKPIAKTNPYTDYLEKTRQLSKNQRIELKIEIDLGKKKVF